MYLDFKTYEKLSDLVYQLSQLSFLYQVLLTSDFSSKDWNSRVMYDILYRFSDNLKKLSEDLTLANDRFVSDAECGNRKAENPG